MSFEKNYLKHYATDHLIPILASVTTTDDSTFPYAPRTASATKRSSSMTARATTCSSRSTASISRS